MILKHIKIAQNIIAWKNCMGFLYILKNIANLKFFAGTFRWVQTSLFWRVISVSVDYSKDINWSFFSHKSPLNIRYLVGSSSMIWYHMVYENDPGCWWISCEKLQKSNSSVCSISMKIFFNYYYIQLLFSFFEQCSCLVK